MTKSFQGPIPDGTAPEVYVPSKSDKERGKWAVVFEQIDENGVPDVDSTAHIIPTYGVNHQISDICWCQPDRKPTRSGDDAIVHTPSQ